MSRIVQIHPQNPQPRLLKQAAEIIQQGAVVVLPTDACYVLACEVGDKEALDRIREIRQLDQKHHLTLMAKDLSQIAEYSKVDNQQYRLLKAITPGAYVFILEGSKELPRRVLHPKRKTIGIRIPNNPIAMGVLQYLENPILTATLQLPPENIPLTEGWEIAERLDNIVDWILDAGHCGSTPTSVIDLTNANEPKVIREGVGGISLFAN